MLIKSVFKCDFDLEQKIIKNDTIQKSMYLIKLVTILIFFKKIHVFFYFSVNSIDVFFFTNLRRQKSRVKDPVIFNVSPTIIIIIII